MGLGHNGAGTQRDWDTAGLGHKGAGTQRDCDTAGLGHNGIGTQRDWDTTGLAHNVIGTQRDWDTTGLGHNVIGTQLDLDTTGQGHNGTGARLSGTHASPAKHREFTFREEKYATHLFNETLHHCSFAFLNFQMGFQILVSMSLSLLCLIFDTAFVGKSLTPGVSFLKYVLPFDF